MENPRRGTKKNTATKMLELVFSKRFCYGLIAILLAIIFVFVWIASSSFNNDFAIRFMPTLIGIIFNFAIFIVFLDLREKFEWKSVEDRVRKKIGGQLRSIFSSIIMLCEVKATTARSLEEIDWNKQSEKELKDLVTNGVKLNNVWKDSKIGSLLSDIFEKHETIISEIEGRYGKFLGSKLQTSLLDIEEYLSRLSPGLLGIVGEEAEIEKAISDLVAKIVREIYELHESGIDIGF